MKHGQKNIKL